MTPEIRRAALRAASRVALVTALGCGGDPKPPPQNVTPPKQQDKIVIEVADPNAADVALQAQKDAARDVVLLEVDLQTHDKKVEAAIDAVVAAQTDADRASATARLAALRKEKVEIEQRLADAKAAGTRAARMRAAASCVAHLDTLPKVKPNDLAANDPLKAKRGVYGAFANVKDREAARTQSCCGEEMTAFGSSAKHRWECCSALPALPADAEQSACTPWGPPCPPEMV
jgi:hypothetical protein